ncbi:DNA repair protein RecN [Mariniluteicoccus endophyticus]
MITELRIANLGVIDSATLEPSPGLTALTGETGAGKTMVVTSLGLLLGERSDSGVVRRGADRARVEGTFAAVPAAVSYRVAEAGGEVDDGELIVARVVGGGRSRSVVGGAGVPVSLAGEIAERLITIHGQSEQVRLARPERQREILDRYAGEALAALMTPYAEAYAERTRLRAELDDLRTHARERAREADVLRFGLEEIEKVDPKPGEDAELAAEAQRLQAVDDLRLAAHRASAALSGDEDDLDAPSTLALASEAGKALDQAAATDETVRPLADRAREVSVLASELAGDVAAYLADLEADPARLEWIAERRAALQGLTRKYGEDVDAVLAWAADAAQRLGGLDGDDARIVEIETRLAELDTTVADLAGRIHEVRGAAADRLATSVQVELAALAMPHARLGFALTPLPEPGPHGGDQVVLQFTANPGSEPRPLARAASGGELSRIRLALEVVLADEDPAQTLVFDEVDAGVGGAVAVEIGRRLARLSKTSQVVVVTHLAQVAAFADTHLVVQKSSDGQVTTSGVRRVDGPEREAELARMMAGLSASDTATAHARELLAEANESR